jgi:hypothetical protein
MKELYVVAVIGVPEDLTESQVTERLQLVFQEQGFLNTGGIFAHPILPLGAAPGKHDDPGPEGEPGPPGIIDTPAASPRILAPGETWFDVEAMKEFEAFQKRKEAGL